MITTAEMIISRSLRLIGTLGESETPTNAEAQDALSSLNSLIASWSLDRLFLYTNKTVEFDLDAASFTIGPSGDVITDRPITIIHALLVGERDYFLKEMSRTDFLAIPKKSTESELPKYFYYEPSFPDGIVHVYPVPSDDITISLDIQVMLNFYSLTESLDLPTGYERALSYALAFELAPEYNVNVSPALAASAAMAVDKIKAVNLEVPILDLQFYDCNKHRFNIRTG